MAWWIISADSTNPYWPPLSEVISAFATTWFEGRFAQDVVPSVMRLLIGYFAAVALGVVFGVVIGSLSTLRKLLEPIMEFFRAVPPPVLIPVIVLLFGIGDEMKILVIISGAIWPVLLNTIEGVRAVDEVLRDTAKCYRFGWRTVVSRLVLPAASPQILVGARIALSVAIILTVISEMFAASNGIGFTIMGFQRTYALPQMWSGIILLGLIGVALSLGFKLVEHVLLRWYRGQRASEREGK